MMKRLLIALSLFVPMHAGAFPETEEAEIKKIGEARRLIGVAMKQAGDAIENRGNDGNRKAYHSALAETFDAHYDCFLAWGHALNSPGISGYFPDRATRVQNMFGRIDGCRDHISDAIAKWTALGETSPVSSLGNADQWLSTFDRSLSYLDWEPDDFPATIGPHGDYLVEQRRFHRFGQYGLGHTVAGGISLYGKASSVPTACNAHLASYLKSAEEMTARHTRGWALFSGIVFTSSWNKNEGNDAATLQAMVDASQGLRPPEFFEVALAAQYLWAGITSNKATPPLGMTAKKNGVNPALFALGAAMANFASCIYSDMEARGQAALAAGNNAAASALFAEMKSHMINCCDTVSAAPREGRLRGFISDFGDGWNDHDGSAFSILNFFHSPPPRPPGGGGGVTCGPGTHEEGGQCVPDPVVCPVFVPGLEALDAVTVRAICVQQ